MTAAPLLIGRQREAQQRSLLNALAVSLPWVVVLAALAFKLAGLWAALAAGGLALGLAAALALRRARKLDRGWLIQALDARFAGFEDSAALLFRPQAELPGFAALQRQRLEGRIGEAGRLDLRQAWSRRPILGSWAAAGVLTAAILLWPAPGAQSAEPTHPRAAASAAPPAITGVRLRITPPIYTGLPAVEQTALDARVPEGSRVEWILGIAPPPSSAALSFPDAPSQPLTRQGDDWSAARVIRSSGLYRIEAPGMALQRLNRIDAVVDAPPVVRIVEPDSQLATVTRSQTRWTPVFEAGDDYGVSSRAMLRITVTKGEGENITFERRTMAVQGSGEARRRRFSTTLDLAREGLAPGGDLIVQLVVADNRTPGPQTVEGPSVILRWPADLALSGGLDGMALSVVPAYFASQRQIIIDAEALIAARRALSPEAFRDRAQRLGEDQAQLRGRYGQYLGEEVEGGGTGGGIALPTNDAPPSRPALPTNNAPEVHAETEDHGHGHDEGGSEAADGEVDVLHEYGHAHDDGDAATLFNPNTRSTLTRALDAMWASERDLRQSDPASALPHAYRALDLLKQAQQATRIFVRRVGSDLPGVDFARRLTGERDDIVAEDLPPLTAPEVDAVAADAWRALEDRPGRRSAPNLAGLSRWVGANAVRLPDALGLAAAIDTVRNEPACRDCRARLRALLWTALERPPAAVSRRAQADARGRRYLDALR